jgi:hypothetical protein
MEWLLALVEVGAENVMPTVRTRPDEALVAAE